MRVGTVVAGRYRVDRFVGAGGTGEVWAAQDMAEALHPALRSGWGSGSGMR